MQQMQTANVGLAIGCVLTRVCQNQGAQTAINATGGLVFAKFSRQDETEADEEGFRNVVRPDEPGGLGDFLSEANAGAGIGTMGC